MTSFVVAMTLCFLLGFILGDNVIWGLGILLLLGAFVYCLR